MPLQVEYALLLSNAMRMRLLCCSCAQIAMPTQLFLKGNGNQTRRHSVVAKATCSFPHATTQEPTALPRSWRCLKRAAFFFCVLNCALFSLLRPRNRNTDEVARSRGKRKFKAPSFSQADKSSHSYPQKCVRVSHCLPTLDEQLSVDIVCASE